MALQLMSIGAAKSLGSAALPGAPRAAHALGKGLNFASKLDQKLLDVAGENDLLAQIAGLLQNGTPMATIVDRIAKQLTDALSRSAGNANQSDPATRRTLERALANALAPPGTSPPTSTGEQAEALEQRLKNLLSTLTGKRETAGQQNEFSGNILDANSAKETPAQQKNPAPTDTSADEVNLFAQALLQKAALGNAVVHAASSNVPDILTRILARAANADAQRSGHVPQPTANTSTAAPSALFQRLIAIVAERSGTQSDANADKQFAQNFAADQNASPGLTNPHQQSGIQSTPAFTTQVAPAPASGPAAPAQTAAPLHTPIDPQAVIEQLVKGITMRNSGTTSELRMRLQPEHLGDVALKLTVTGNTITANVIAQNAHVRDLLLANQQQLARSLSQAGLSLGNFSVDVSGGNGGFTQQQAQQQQRASARPGAFDVAALSGEDAQWTDPRFGPSILPMGKSLVLNYLV